MVLFSLQHSNCFTVVYANQLLSINPRFLTHIIIILVRFCVLTLSAVVLVHLPLIFMLQLASKFMCSDLLTRVYEYGFHCYTSSYPIPKSWLSLLIVYLFKQYKYIKRSKCGQKASAFCVYGSLCFTRGSIWGRVSIGFITLDRSTARAGRTTTSTHVTRAARTGCVSSGSPQTRTSRTWRRTSTRATSTTGVLDVSARATSATDVLDVSTSQ